MSRHRDVVGRPSAIVLLSSQQQERKGNPRQKVAGNWSTRRRPSDRRPEKETRERETDVRLKKQQKTNRLIKVSAWPHVADKQADTTLSSILSACRLLRRRQPNRFF